MFVLAFFFFFFKQKTAYEMRISDWSSDVCSSDLLDAAHGTTRVCDGLERCGRHDQRHCRRRLKDQREGRRALHHDRSEAGEGHISEAAKSGERQVNKHHTIHHALEGCSETVREYGAVACPTGRGEMMCNANEIAGSRV